MHQPSWYKDKQILIVNSLTCGINKDGHEQYIVNPETGVRSASEINDKLAEACDEISSGTFDRSDVSFQNEEAVISKDIFVPKYYDNTVNIGIKNLVNDNDQLELKSLGELLKYGFISITGGHGSPSSDQRLGTIPYIKVSDLRAGLVNINPTNRIPIALAKGFWGGDESGLKPYDLISPERASKNIGEFCVLMPGQQDIVLTKEVIVIRTTTLAVFDQFFLMWALSLREVYEQWERVIFMQTNREDVGKRMLEILIPVATDAKTSSRLSKPFRDYFENMETARRRFIQSINTSGFEHHIHWGEFEAVDDSANSETSETRAPR